VVDGAEDFGAFVVDGVVADAAGELEEGELDGGTVLERGDVEDGVGAGEEEFGVGDGGRRRAVVGVMEVAELLAAQAGRAAAVAKGVDVAADQAGYGLRVDGCRLCCRLCAHMRKSPFFVKSKEHSGYEAFPAVFEESEMRIKCETPAVGRGRDEKA